VLEPAHLGERVERGGNRFAGQTGPEDGRVRDWGHRMLNGKAMPCPGQESGGLHNREGEMKVVGNGAQ
jgi:hypothetical protein